MKRQLHDMQRINNLCCLKIVGVPKSTLCNYDWQIIKNLANHYRINLEPDDVKFCSRLKGKAQMPPIMVRFGSKNTPLKLSDISEDNIESRVYINEHLTQHNLTIYHECLRIQLLKYIATVLTRRGSVYISESSNKESGLVRVESIYQSYLRDKYPMAYTHITR